MDMLCIFMSHGPHHLTPISRVSKWCLGPSHILPCLTHHLIPMVPPKPLTSPQNLICVFSSGLFLYLLLHDKRRVILMRWWEQTPPGTEQTSLMVIYGVSATENPASLSPKYIIWVESQGNTPQPCSNDPMFCKDWPNPQNMGVPACARWKEMKIFVSWGWQGALCSWQEDCGDTGNMEI